MIVWAMAIAFGDCLSVGPGVRSGVGLGVRR